jgi:hypothetical protein
MTAKQAAMENQAYSQLTLRTGASNGDSLESEVYTPA